MSSRKFSGYFSSLDAEAKARYVRKLNEIGAAVDDPYTLQSFCQPLEMPEITYPDIYNYLINSSSPYTHAQLKAYKNLDGYKHFVAGWVSDVGIHRVSSTPPKFILRAKVRHSQAVSAPPLQPWVAVEKCGIVIAAHCTCMAGLGEACSHVSALLFNAEAQANLARNESCTSDACGWLVPSGRNVVPAPLAEIDFGRPSTKKARMENEEQLGSNAKSTSNRSSMSVPEPTAGELEEFYSALSRAGKPVILSIIPPYSDRYATSQAAGRKATQKATRRNARRNAKK